MADVFHELGSAGAAADALQVPAAFQRDDLAVRPHFDRWVVLDAAHEVARHALGQSARAHHDEDAVAVLGEEHGGLAGGVAAAGEDYPVSPPCPPPLPPRCAVPVS